MHKNDLIHVREEGKRGRAVHDGGDVRAMHRVVKNPHIVLACLIIGACDLQMAAQSRQRGKCDRVRATEIGKQNYRKREYKERQTERCE